MPEKYYEPIFPSKVNYKITFQSEKYGECQWLVDASGKIIDCPVFLRPHWIGRHVHLKKLVQDFKYDVASNPDAKTCTDAGLPNGIEVEVWSNHIKGFNGLGVLLFPAKVIEATHSASLHESRDGNNFMLDPVNNPSTDTTTEPKGKSDEPRLPRIRRSKPKGEP